MPRLKGIQTAFSKHPAGLNRSSTPIASGLYVPRYLIAYYFMISSVINKR